MRRKTAKASELSSFQFAGMRDVAAGDRSDGRGVDGHDGHRVPVERREFHLESAAVLVRVDDSSNIAGFEPFARNRIGQNDADVFGSGTHDKTGRHCLPLDPNGKLDVVRHAGFWMRDERGEPTRKFQHICWDGCMFPNDTMMQAQTWNDILRLMMDVRAAHGWNASVASRSPSEPC